MKRLFGTDGIRGVAGDAPLDPPTVHRFGAALAEVLSASGARGPRIVLGRDTRESGPWLRDAVAAGLASRSAASVDAGVITTPGLAFAVAAGRFDAGVMISASHNPFADNGLKVFRADGTKFPDAAEAEVEKKILDPAFDAGADGRGSVPEDGALALRYIAFLEGAVGPAGRFRGLRLVLDCANGAAHRIAPEVFRHHGAYVAVIGDAPDGRNINLDCGSTHMDALRRAVTEGGFDYGIAFDGDADRALLVDRKGRLVDGDHILYLASRKIRKEGGLRGNAVVGTVMSNLWLEHLLAADGVRLLRAPVGDKYVLERMVADDVVLGGEQSGHVIFRERSTTGDGILTALVTLDAILEEDEPLESLLDRIVPCPQLLLNVPVRKKPDLREHPEVGPVVAEAEAALAGSGRIVLRYSGTEPLVRVMVEATDEAAVRRWAEQIADTVRRAIG
jgi:phosphoglucosamine mutase